MLKTNLPFPRVLTDFLLKKALFRPTQLAADHRFVFAEPFEELFFHTPDGARLNALFFPTAQKNKRGTVLYFHGNRDNLQRWGAMHQPFSALGYDFLAPDYRGYGKSTGEPDEARYFEDAALIYNWLRERVAAHDIVLYGRSLGSGMASHLAARVPARLLALETPFDSIRGLLTAHWGREKPPFEPTLFFPNDKNVQKTTCPVLIFHGTRDRVVPFASANNLRHYLKAGDEFVTIEGGSHHNLGEYPHYHERLQAWLAAGA
jgi:hypothetical protein